MSKKLKILTNIFVVGILLLVLVTAGLGEEDFNSTNNYVLLKPTAAKQVRTMSNIGNWAYWIQYDGWSGRHPTTGESGGIYPRGTAAAIFQDGIIWGGFVRDGVQPEKRVGGQTYSIGTTPGRIISQGVAQDLADDDVRIYRIRKDWETITAADVKQDAAEVNNIALNDVTDAQTQAVLDQYALDWSEWPVEYGAPFNDENGNGIMDAGEDPGIANADQAIWFVVNDLSEGNTLGLYGAKPMGIELQVTMWAYNQSGSALGQMIFKKYKFINKSGVQIDSMFVAQWVDPDLGNYADDLVGCDTLLSLGYVFNGSGNDDQYADFGLPPAAAGYDFFQGPIVFTGDPADTAVFDLKYRVGYKNLPMTSFSWFAAGSNISDPPLASYQGTVAWYNMLNGFTPTTTDSLVPYLVGSGPGTGNTTVFPLAGDPVTDTGDIDGKGNNFSPSDRRMVLTSGPFTMVPGDTQEVVIALVGGIQAGGDQLTSVAAMKSNDDIAQKVYNTLFQGIPNPPTAPKVSVTEQEEQIVLEWGSNSASVSATEDLPNAGYAFEGYNVYQLPSASAGLDQATRIATFDLVNGVKEIVSPVFNSTTGQFYDLPVQFGTDIGIKRYFIVEKDYINDVALNAGNEYYFAVTAYNYNPAPPLIQDRALESSVQALVVVPQSTNPGVRYGAGIGEEVEVTHSAGGSDGVIQVKVIDPKALTGDEYEIFFAEFEEYADILDSNGVVTGEDTTVIIGWNVRTSGGVVKVANQIQAATLEASDTQPIFDGIQVKVTGPALDFKDFQCVANASGDLAAPVGAAADYQGFPGLGRENIDQQQTNGSTWFIHHNDETDGSYESAFRRLTQYSGGYGEANMGIQSLIPDDFEIRFTSTPGKAFFQWSTITVEDVPFEIWNVGDASDPSDDFRCFPWVLEGGLTDDNGVFEILDTDHAASGGTNDPFTESIYWVEPLDRTPGQSGYDALLAAHIADPAGADAADLWAYLTPDPPWSCVAGMMRMVFVNWNGGDVPGPYDADMPEEGTIFRIITSKPNTLSDAFSFAGPANTQSTTTAADDVKKINVFPNPYYAFNPSELNRSENFVTFTHLPKEATIRIFNLAGVQVRKIEKDIDSQFQIWDLQNESGLPVASGIYFVHVDMPKLGKVKNLKVFIIQSQQILEFY